MNKLFEGGNVFKDADKKSLTQRIATKDVPATIDYIEKITGLDFTKELDPDPNFFSRIRIWTFLNGYI